MALNVSAANGIPEGYRVQFINGFVEELVSIWQSRTGRNLLQNL
jgi:hypothetical protein